MEGALSKRRLQLPTLPTFLYSEGNRKRSWTGNKNDSPLAQSVHGSNPVLINDVVFTVALGFDSHWLSAVSGVRIKSPEQEREGEISACLAGQAGGKGR